MRSILPLVIVLLIGVGLVAVVYGLAGRAPTVSQPIAFNHKLHVEEADLQCLDCHTDAETAVHAGLPGKAICLDCHDVDEEIEDDSELVKLVPLAEADGDIPWVRVAVTKPDVFFSHRRHVGAGGIDCQRCHADQPKLTAPPSAVQEVLTMDDCIDCHR
ncbi:MAG: cytochrome c3 family protein, partial [Planctomycetota bacterium]